MKIKQNIVMKNILVFDNYDSFTFNLVDYFKVLGAEVKVYRNSTPVEEILREEFDLLVLSPGPSVPKNAGRMMELIDAVYLSKPILGVCLGHQALIQHFGGTLEYVEPMHGKSDYIIHDQKTIYTGLAEKIEIGRYHSLVGKDIPTNLEVSARTVDGTVMSVRHKYLPIEGIQYHPESVLSMRDEVGMRILENVIAGRLSTGNVHYYRLMRKIMEEEELESDDIHSFVDVVTEGQLSEDQNLVLLTSMSLHLNDPELLSVFINSLLEKSPSIDVSWKSEGIDVCGTGGSGLPRFNTSTMTALLLAAAGIKIIKHGNKAATGRMGSFDVLEKLDINIRPETDVLKKAYNSTNVAFLFAPVFHPALKHIGPSRARLGVPTIINQLGPLLNPLRPAYQFMGTSSKRKLKLLIEVGRLLGRKKMSVVRGEDGLDDITVSAPTCGYTLNDGEIAELTLSPEDFGIKTVPFEEISCESPEETLQIIQKMLAGKVDSEHYKLVAANAAFVASYFYGQGSLEECFKSMEEKIRKGVLGKVLEEYRGVVAN